MTATLTKSRTYSIDPSHSSLEFIVRHLMISKVRGRFTSFTGTIEVSEDNKMPSRITASIDVSSLDTHEAQRDTHLKSAEFFDLEQYPKIMFESTNISGTDRDFQIMGNLTMHGVKRPITLMGQYTAQATDPWGNERIGYEASGKINRKDFDLLWNQPLETGGVLIGEDVILDLNIEAILTND
jgi:polyisoprenoid-binding protein YceI